VVASGAAEDGDGDFAPSRGEEGAGAFGGGGAGGHHIVDEEDPLSGEGALQGKGPLEVLKAHPGRQSPLRRGRMATLQQSARDGNGKVPAEFPGQEKRLVIAALPEAAQL